MAGVQALKASRGLNPGDSPVRLPVGSRVEAGRAGRGGKPWGGDRGGGTKRLSGGLGSLLGTTVLTCLHNARGLAPKKWLFECYYSQPVKPALVLTWTGGKSHLKILPGVSGSNKDDEDRLWDSVLLFKLVASPPLLTACSVLVSYQPRFAASQIWSGTKSDGDVCRDFFGWVDFVDEAPAKRLKSSAQRR